MLQFIYVARLKREPGYGGRCDWPGDGPRPNQSEYKHPSHLAESHFKRAQTSTSLLSCKMSIDNLLSYFSKYLHMPQSNAIS